MSEAMRRVRQVTGVTPDRIPLEELMAAQEPAVFKGLACDWPLAARGREGAAAAIAYLKSFDAGRPVVGYTGAPEIGGRFFYNEDLTGLNFHAARVPLGEFLDRIGDSIGKAASPTYYIGSTDLDLYLPGLRADNDLGLDAPRFGSEPPVVSIWIGNRTVASAHFDMSNNLACSLVGRRRFTLFPPDQVGSLYPGPLEPTPGGQVVSMVDFAARALITVAARPSASSAVATCSRRCTIGPKPTISRSSPVRSTSPRPISSAIRASPKRSKRGKWPSSSRGTCSFIRPCGGITSRRSSPSTR